MTRTRRIAAALSAALMFAPAAARAQDTRPVVAVLYFDNNSIGKDRADYDGLGKGIADLLITDLAGSSRLRVVERERVQKLLEEQNLVRGGAIDAQTAVRLGKLLGASYMVTGGFMSDGRGSMVLTSRAISVETGQITNPARVQEKTDDVLGLIAKMSEKLNAELKLPAIVPQRTGDATRGQDAQSGHAAHQATQVAVKQAAKPVKLDVRTTILYSKALEEQDQGRPEKAAELYRAVLTKFPDFEPAQKGFDRVSKRTGS
jgi:TolB-like protein